MVHRMNDEIVRALNKAKEVAYEADIEETFELLTHLFEKYPDNLDIQAELGVLQSKLDRDDIAERIFREVISIDSNHERAISALGHLLDSTLRVSEAEQLYRDFLKRNGDNHCVVEDLCRLLVSEKRVDEALSLATQHFTSQPKVLDAYNPIRFVLLQLEDLFEVQVEENNYSAKSRFTLLKNQLHQFEVYLTIEENVECDIKDDADCLHDDLLRAYGDVIHLYNLLKNQNFSFPDQVDKQVEEAMKKMESNSNSIPTD